MFLENLLLALKAIWSNKMRSLLTTLGIVIGVAAVIAVVSLVDGFSRVIRNELQGLGATSIIVQPHRPPGKEGEKLGRVELTWEDGEALIRICPLVETATPVIQQFSKTKFEDTSADLPIIGVQPVFQDVRNYYVGEGRFFGELDERERLRVCVIGHGVLNELKLPADPIGRDVHIGDSSYRIVGVMEAKGQILGEELDKFVMIPFGTAVGVYGDEVSKQIGILVRAKSAEVVDQAADQIEEALRVRHRLRPDQPNDFEVHTQKEFLKTVTNVTNVVAYIVAGIVSIALLVGGIGIMNIMLVSVTERTREIGVRKAVGARRGHILLQFMIEAVMLAVVGGAVGILAGIGVGSLAAAVIPNWPGASVPLWSVILSFGFSSGVGLFFGIYPAAKASRLDPIESLRYE
jgi:putative ABC transport system permease protein